MVVAYLNGVHENGGAGHPLVLEATYQSLNPAPASYALNLVPLLGLSLFSPPLLADSPDPDEIQFCFDHPVVTVNYLKAIASLASY